MNKLTHQDTLNEHWRNAKRERFRSLLRQGYQANVTLADMSEFLQKVASPDLLASTRIVDLLAVGFSPVTPRQLRAPSPLGPSPKPTTKRIKRRQTRAQSAALEAAILDRVNTGQTPVSTAQIIAVLQSQFSGLNPKTVDNKLRDLHRHGKIRKHPSLRATWMKQTLAVPPTIVRRAERTSETQPS